jgi:T5orf172 domain/Sel1 repeat
MKEIGYVYVLANSAMPNIVKVGKTTRSPSERAEELSKVTSLPTPFIVVYEQRFTDCSAAESFVHVYLESKGYRIAGNREFFNAPINIIVKSILLAPNPISDDSLMLELEDSNSLEYKEPDELDELCFDGPQPWTDIFEEAESYYYGLGDYIEDTAEAMRLFKQAAKLGSLPAYGRIGNMYERGEVGKREDKSKALEFYKEGARKGSIHCYWLMAVFFRAEDNDQNAEKCFSLFLKNKPQGIMNTQCFSSDELEDILSDCCRFLKFKLEYNKEYPDILKNFMIENSCAIARKAKLDINYYTDNNNLAGIEAANLVLQHVNSLINND